MKTPTHFLIGHCCARLFGWRGTDARLVIAGACLPDLPIIVCWPAIAVYTIARDGAFDFAVFRVITDSLYFSENLVSGLHNLLHSPVSIGILVLLTGILLPASPVLRRGCVLVLVGAFSHSLLDVATHIGDGPLVLWPLDQTVRVRGIVSHWDPVYGGIWVTGAEVVVTGLIAVVIALRHYEGPIMLIYRSRSARPDL